MRREFLNLNLNSSKLKKVVLLNWFGATSIWKPDRISTKTSPDNKKSEECKILNLMFDNSIYISGIGKNSGFQISSET